MINANRWLDIAMFKCNVPVKIGEKTIETGLQQVFRQENKYIFAKIGKKPYVEISMEHNEKVVRVIFSKEIIEP